MGLPEPDPLSEFRVLSLFAVGFDNVRRYIGHVVYVALAMSLTCPTLGRDTEASTSRVAKREPALSCFHVLRVSWRRQDPRQTNIAPLLNHFRLVNAGSLSRFPHPLRVAICHLSVPENSCVHIDMR